MNVRLLVGCAGTAPYCLIVCLTLSLVGLNSTGIQSPIFVPGTGSFVRINDDGSFDTLVSGLTFPSAVVRGPDDAFYLSTCGYHCAPGDGQILRIAVQ